MARADQDTGQRAKARQSEDEGREDAADFVGREAVDESGHDYAAAFLYGLSRRPICNWLYLPT